MKYFSKFIFLLALGAANIHCSGGSSNSAPPPAAQAVAVYSINDVFSQGVDDSGNMWLEIDGAFSGSGDSVVLSCDGNALSPTVQTDSVSAVVVSVPAASSYNSCNFIVQGSGISSNTFSESISAINVSDVSNEALDASNSSKIDIELDGNFFVTPLINSTLSVEATCDGGNTYFSPSILFQSTNNQTGENSVVVRLSDPGTGHSEQCSFFIEDTFTDPDNNIVTVPSPAFSAQVNGI